MKNNYKSKFSRNGSTLKFSDENLNKSPDWTILTSQYTLIDDKFDLNENSPKQVTIIQQDNTQFEEQVSRDEKLEVVQTEQTHPNFQYQSQIVQQLQENEVADILVSEVFQYPQLSFENYVEPENIQVSVFRLNKSKLIEKIAVSLIKQKSEIVEQEQQNQIVNQNITEDNQENFQQQNDDEQKNDPSVLSQEMKYSEEIKKSQEFTIDDNQKPRRQAIDNSLQKLETEQAKISTFKNNALEFLIVNEDFELNVDTIHTYTNDQLQNAINQAHILIKKDNYLNFQATLWTKRIPMQIIRKLWLKLINIDDLKKKYQSFDYLEQRFLYEKKSINYTNIMKDLHRTFGNDESTQESLKWQESLKNILIAYSNLDSQVGYTQGMNYIVGTLLVLLNTSYDDQQEQNIYKITYEDEEQAFWIFVYLMMDSERQWREYFRDGIPGIFNIMPRLLQRLNHSCPKVYQHLRSIGVFDFTILFSPYFHTIMTQSAQWEFSIIIITLLLIDGTPFFLQLITSLCVYSEQKILSIKDLETALCFFRYQFVQDFHLKLKQVESEKEIIQILLDIGLINGEHFSMMENTYLIQPIERAQDIKILSKKIFNKIQNFFSRMKKE